MVLGSKGYGEWEVGPGECPKPCMSVAKGLPAMDMGRNPTSTWTGPKPAFNAKLVSVSLRRAGISSSPAVAFEWLNSLAPGRTSSLRFYKYYI